MGAVTDPPPPLACALGELAPEFAPWNEPEETDGPQVTRLEQAAGKLRDLLADGQWHPLSEVKAGLVAAGFGEEMALLAIAHVSPERRHEGSFVFLRRLSAAA